MSLSSDLISQFVKITNDNNTDTKSETSRYGTIVEYNGSKYVKLDGSELLTPIESTVSTAEGDRVTVTIKDHTATVTGNISDPSASGNTVTEIGNQISKFEIIIADKVSVEELDAANGRIDNLVSDNVTIKEKLTAVEGEFDDLVADNVVINEKLTANEATIKELQTTKLDAEVADLTYATIGDLDATNANIYNLEATYGAFADLTTNKLSAIDATIKDLDTNKLSAEEADLKYANIDFSNIGQAAVEKIFSESGIIKDLIVSEGTITGELVGVTIKGDLIEGGTVIADKLVIKGEDGLYYKLNTDGETIETEQTEYNSLDGKHILAQSITATKINVDDLVAFDATIGGFNISDNSIYSGVKESVDNTTRGVYLDNEGQIAFGDSNNFIKYYRDQNGDYKLEISAKSILLGSSSKSVETTIENAQTSANEANEAISDTAERINNVEATLGILNDALATLVTDGNGMSLMTQTETGWTFNIAEIQNAVDSASDSLNVLQETLGDTNATIKALDQAVKDLGETAEYIDIKTYEDEPCIQLGESDSDFKLLITNTRIMFMEGSDVPTYISNKGLVTKNIEVENELKQGGFIWKIHGSGNLGLIWKGAEE